MHEVFFFFFYLVQSIDLSFRFYLEQRLKFEKEDQILGGRRETTQQTAASQRRWPPPFFTVLVTLAEVGVASACEQHGDDPTWLRRPHHWLSDRLLPFTSLQFH